MISEEGRMTKIIFAILALSAFTTAADATTCTWYRDQHCKKVSKPERCAELWKQCMETGGWLARDIQDPKVDKR